MRERLDGMLKQIEATKKGDSELPKKKSKTAEPVVDLEAEDKDFQATPTLSKVEDLLKDLEQRATAAQHHAAQEFYGCPRCRWARSGCAWYGCNPVKWQIHRSKYPEKYKDEKNLKIEAARKITDAEMMEDPKIDTIE